MMIKAAGIFIIFSLIFSPAAFSQDSRDKTIQETLANLKTPSPEAEIESPSTAEASAKLFSRRAVIVDKILPEGANQNEWGFSGEVSTITYEEPGIMEEEGRMYGVSGFYVFNNLFGDNLKELKFKVDGKISNGQIDYTSVSTGSLNNIDDIMFEIRGVAMQKYRTSDLLTLIPYLGFGYRYLNDDSSGLRSTTGAYGYERVSNYFYSPVGIETLAQWRNGWLLGFTAEFDIFWHGVQHSHLSDVNVSYSDLENSQSSGYGVRGSFKFGKKIAKMEFLIEPFIKYWDIDTSTIESISYSGFITGYGYEPKNESTEIGVKAGIKF